MDGLTIEAKTIPQGFRVALSGEADATNSEILDAEIQRMAAANPKLVAFDLSNLIFISSAAMGALVKMRGLIFKSGGRVVIGGTSPQIREAFRRARLDQLLEFVDAV